VLVTKKKLINLIKISPQRLKKDSNTTQPLAIAMPKYIFKVATECFLSCEYWQFELPPNNASWYNLAMNNRFAYTKST